MRWIVLAALTCLVCVASVASATTGSPGPSPRRDSLVTAPQGDSLRAPKQGRPERNGPKNPSKIALDEPISAVSPTSSTVQTIESLANGESMVNPWFPGRGAIGVNVKVTW